MEFLIDDFAESKKYISTLPTRIKKLRFNRYATSGIPDGWNPTHVVLALKDGKAVAMADSVASEVGSVSSAAIVGNNGFGAYAIQALLKLKNMFPADRWISCLVNPNHGLAKISARYVDRTYDKIADEISQHLVKTNGVYHYFEPTPLFPSQSTLNAYELPSISKLDIASKNQIMFAAKDPMSRILICPEGTQIVSQDLFSIVFEVFDMPFEFRQSISRFMLLNAAVMHGHNVNSGFMKRHAKSKNLKGFLSTIKNASIDTSTLKDGIFSIQSISE